MTRIDTKNQKNFRGEGIYSLIGAFQTPMVTWIMAGKTLAAPSVFIPKLRLDKTTVDSG
jgi:hypothetical protein